MATFKCTFRGKMGLRDDIRAEIYYKAATSNIGAGGALDASEQIINRVIPTLLIKGRSVRKVASVERTMLRVFRFHRVLEGEIQDDGSIAPIQPLTIAAEEAAPVSDGPSDAFIADDQADDSSN